MPYLQQQLNQTTDQTQNATVPGSSDTTTTLSGGGGLATGGVSAGTSSPSAATTGSGSGSANASSSPGGFLDYNQIFSQNAGTNPSTGSLLDPFKQLDTNIRGQIDTSKSDFMTKAGPADSYGDAQRNAINNYISGGQGYDAAHNYLNAKYTGPTALDDTSWSGALNKYGTDVTGLRDNLAGSLQGLYPTLSTGDRAYNAMLLGQNQDFQNRLGSAIGQYNSTTGYAGTARTDAANYAAQRAQQEADVAAKSRAQVTDWQNSFNTAQAQQAQSEAARNAALQQEYNALRAGGAGQNVGGVDLGWLQPYTPTLADIGAGAVAAPPPGANAQLLNEYQAVMHPAAMNLGGYVNYAANNWAPTTAEMVDPTEANQFNNSQRLLDSSNFISPGAYRPSTITGDQAGYTAGRSAAQSALSAALARYNADLAAFNAPRPAAAAPTYVDPNAGLSAYGGGGDAGVGGPGSAGIGSAAGIGPGVGPGVGSDASADSSAAAAAPGESDSSAGPGAGGESSGAGSGGGSGGGGTVICTELHRQGLMPAHIYVADELYGSYMRLVDGNAYRGYLCWAKYVVAAMQRSPLVTRLVRVVAEPWSREMAFRVSMLPQGSLVGRVMMAVGVPVCRLIGALQSKLKLALA